MFMISVIVPIYNVDKYLERCLNSLVNQTYKHFEVLLINDGSTDFSEQICKRYCKEDTRFKYYKKKNEGLSSARNYGLDRADGEYIFFLDSDDSLDKNILELMINSIGTADLIFCDVKIIEDNENIVHTPQKSLVETTKFSGIEVIERIYDEISPLKYVVIWNKLYKRDLFFNVRFPIGKIHEDEFVNYLLYYKSSLIKYIDYPGYLYYKRKGSITNSGFNINHIDCLEALNQRHVFFEKHKWKKLTEKNISIMLYLLNKNISLFYTNNECLKDNALDVIRRSSKDIMQSKYATFRQKTICLYLCIYRYIKHLTIKR